MSGLGLGLDGTTQPGVPGSTPQPAPVALLTVYPPPLAGNRLELAADTVLGRFETSAGLLHETVSRRHAEVVVLPGSVMCLRDLGSRNGTRVDGAALGAHPVPILPQMVVRLGDVLAVVVQGVDTRFDADLALPGVSPAMAAARETLDCCARETTPVLVRGETGTGKERVAREVHRRSGRKGPLVSLSCAELSPQLIESQLFGHERGAFTGATSSKDGLFAQANGGTLFLDEIGELPLDLQPKLLRVIQEGELRVVGGTRVQRVDVRIVSATNRDLSTQVEQGGFRRDLLARLCTWEVLLPPLRERKEDILPWFSWLVQSRSRERGRAMTLELVPGLAERLLIEPWRDNLRGLDRVVQRLSTQVFSEPVTVGQAASLLPELFGSNAEIAAVRSSAPPPPDVTSHNLANSHVRPTSQELLRVYEECGRSVRATAKHFGKDRRQIYRWLESFGIRREEDGD